jgi:hypothetical protein
LWKDQNAVAFSPSTKKCAENVASKQTHVARFEDDGTKYQFQ